MNVYIEAAGNLTKDGIKAIHDVCEIKKTADTAAVDNEN